MLHMSDQTPAGTNGQIPEGWYPDPTNGGRMRRWDGQAWTDEFAPEAAAAPKKSPLPWILAGVGALVVLIVGGVIAAVVISSLGRATSAAAGPDVVSTDYVKAWWAADCQGYMAATTADFREWTFEPDGGFSCEVFESLATDIYGDNTGLGIVVRSTDIQGDHAEVFTTETATSPIDGPRTIEWRLELLRVNGTWLIDVEEDITDF